MTNNNKKPFPSHTGSSSRNARIPLSSSRQPPTGRQLAVSRVVALRQERSRFPPSVGNLPRTSRIPAVASGGSRVLQVQRPPLPPLIPPTASTVVGNHRHLSDAAAGQRGGGAGERSGKTSVEQQNKRHRPMVDPDVHRLAVEKPDNLKRVGNTMHIFRFDPSTLHTQKDGKRIAIIGASGSGKSRLALQLSRAHCQSIPVWSIFNPSEPANHMYSPHVENESIIHDEEHPKLIIKDLYKLKSRQIKKCKEWWIKDTDPPEYDPDPSLGVILDDMGEDTKIFNDPIFGWLYCNSRNFKVWIIILLQFWYMLLKKYRRQVSHLFVFFMADNNDIKQLYNEYCSFFGAFDDFKRCFMLATANRGTLVIDVARQTANPHEKIFWYTHQMKQPPFKYGADWFNKTVMKRYDPEWERRLETQDIDDSKLLLPRGTVGASKKRETAVAGSAVAAPRRKRAKTAVGRRAANGDDDEPMKIELI